MEKEIKIVNMELINRKTYLEYAIKVNKEIQESNSFCCIF